MENVANANAAARNKRDGNARRKEGGIKGTRAEVEAHLYAIDVSVA
jgi:hypothetical protein